MNHYFINAEIFVYHNGSADIKKINGVFEIESPDKISKFVEDYFSVTSYFDSVKWNIFYHNIQLLSTSQKQEQFKK